MIHPDQFASASPYQLWSEAARGRVLVDQRFFRALLHRPEEALGDTVRFCLEDRRQDPLDLSMELVDFFRLLPSPEALPFLLALLEPMLDDPPEALIDAIARLGSAPIKPLIEMFRRIPDWQPEIAFVLASLGVRDERIRGALEELLASDPLMGVLPVEMYADPALRPAVEGAIGRLEPDQPPIEPDQPPGHRLRQELENLLGYLDNPPPPAVSEPYDVLADYGDEGEPPLYILPWQERLEFLSCPYPEYRLAAAHGFQGETAVADAAMQALLATATADADIAVRCACWEAFAEPRIDPGILAEMRGRLENPATPAAEKASILIGLSATAPDPLMREWMPRLYEQPECRAKVLEAMWRSLDRGLGHYMLRHLNDADPEVRLMAVQGAGYLRVEEAAGRLKDLFEDEDLRWAALASYALAAPGKTSRAQARTLFDEIEELAGGLSEDESGEVESAIDLRLHFHGMRPVFTAADTGVPAEPSAVKVGRNDPCPCGSGKKYKKCCDA